MGGLVALPLRQSEKEAKKLTCECPYAKKPLVRLNQLMRTLCRVTLQDN